MHQLTHPAAGIEKNHRILVVDDNEAIHADFKKILGTDDAESEFDAAEAEFFGESTASTHRAQFEMDFAFQGQDALDLVRAAMKTGRRYAMAFMDVRMPPGWDGMETTLKLWEADPDIQIVICTAYSDYSWDEMMKMIGSPERLMILKKPFDSIEVLQFAHALTEKWSLLQAARHNTEALESAVAARTRELNTANALLQKEIAGHKAADERVREQAMLLEEAREAIIVRSLDEKIVFWNRGAERLYGLSAAEAVGRSILDALHSGVEEENVRVARKALFEKGSWIGEIPQKTREGRVIISDCHWTLIRDEQGNPKSVLAINSDITEKKELEMQILRAQRLDGIGSLASGIAHDLNNLLSPIILSVDLLKGSVDEGDQKLLEAVDVSAQRAADIVKQLLYFAKGGETDRIEIHPVRILRDIEKITTETFPKSIRVETTVSRDTWMLKADPTQMQQVLLNLCLNARDAMPTGGKITISVRNIDVDVHNAATIWGLHSGPHVLIKVEDTGAGIPPELLQKIFEPFFTTKDFGKGTGLGLSTVFGIIKNHDGAITVSSQPGMGTSFSIYLPAVTTASGETADSLPPECLAGNDELVLVVDDEPSILAVTQRSLETAGYRVLTAGDGVEAVEIATKHKDEISAVLTDMMMPVLDGPSTIRALKKIVPELRFIGSSGGGNHQHQEAAVAAGATRFITKPYSSETLLQAMHETLNGRIPPTSRTETAEPCVMPS